ncbi:hypothetical protein ACPA9J_15965 [Pseudomonas aeruginosa]
MLRPPLLAWLTMGLMLFRRPAHGLLQKGERVTTAETSAKLDRTLDDVRSNQGQSGNTTVNIVENKARAGQVERRRDGRQEFLEVFVADINGDGPASRAIAQAFGIRRSGT